MVADVRALGPLDWRAHWSENSGSDEAIAKLQAEHDEAMEVPA
jgi:hypothetical protein